MCIIVEMEREAKESRRKQSNWHENEKALSSRVSWTPFAPRLFAWENVLEFMQI